MGGQAAFSARWTRAAARASERLSAWLFQPHEHLAVLFSLRTCRPHEPFDLVTYRSLWCARVTGRGDAADVTLFGGHAVGQAIASLFLGRGLARNAMTDWCAPAAEEPAWHDEALSGIGQICSWAAAVGDPYGALGLAHYLAGEYVEPSAARDVLLLDKVVAALGPVDRAAAVHDVYRVWKDAPKTADLGEQIARVLAGVGRSDRHPGFDSMQDVIRTSALELEQNSA